VVDGPVVNQSANELAEATARRLLLLHRGWLLSFALLTRLLHYRWLLALRLTLAGSRSLPTLPLLLVVLPRYRVLRPIAVVLLVDDRLLLHSGISGPRVLTLIDGQRGGRDDRPAVPLIPSAAALLPASPPVLAPSRREASSPGSVSSSTPDAPRASTSPTNW